MYERSLRNAVHTRRFSIRPNLTAGWDIIEEFDSEILKRVSYSDWHRVERARAAFVQEAGRLCENGWVDAQP